MQEREILVGMGSCGLAAGGQKVYERFTELLAETNEVLWTGEPAIKLKKTGCIGLCYAEPLIEVIDSTHDSVFYGNVTPEKAEIIFKRHIIGGEPAAELVFDAKASLSRQKRIVLRNSGVIDPDNLEEYVDRDGYRGLFKALIEMTPEEVISTITYSGLRGRGGAGFPTGMKWKFAAAAQGDHKYIICNADEGDPGAFMDRSVLESDPHSVLEGMAIAAYAIGADTGYIYVRAEYPEAIKHLKRAIADATAGNYLGENIMRQGFNFHIRLKEGAGAFVCGEETALIASIEGKRGMPRVRPPFPVESGLWGHPTCINNVETLANVPWIVLRSHFAFRELGTEGSKGTKVFALAGKIKNGGLVEVPMGMTLKEVIEGIGGGTTSGAPFKAVQMGGPSGGCIPYSLGDTPVDYEQITATGAIMGSGGMVVMDETTCMVDVARFFLSFTQNESCGKCTFCRIGTKRMLEILERICAGQGKEEDIGLLRELGEQIKSSSLCGLGQSAPNPVLTTLRYFMDEYTAHIRDKKCPAKSCPALVEFVIDAPRCIGCGLCLSSCPVGAITGEKKKAHVIDAAKCVRCGKCMTVCAVSAIEKR